MAQRFVASVYPFIDGTVEGNPADMTIAPYLDVDTTHDHTYYGNGCPNSWGTSGNGGSITPCSTRIVKDGNNEDQKTGTLYHYMAASSGSGTTASVRNDIIPDTFCPLGWQMPYSGSGGDYYDKSKSWKYLLDTYGILHDEGTIADGTKAASYPFSYVQSGFYGWHMGRIYYQNINAYYWSIIVSSYNSSFQYAIYDHFIGIKVARSDDKRFGMPVRCNNCFSVLHRRHGGRNECRLSRKQYL